MKVQVIFEVNIKAELLKKKKTKKKEKEANQTLFIHPVEVT